MPVRVYPLKGKHARGAVRACSEGLAGRRQRLAGCRCWLQAGQAQHAQQAYQKAFMMSRMEPSAAVEGVTSRMLSLST